MQWSDLLLLSYSVMLFPLQTWSNLLFSSIALTEIVWLCMWPATWRIKCTASIHSSHCMWGYSRTGASRPYESISVVYRCCDNVFFYITTCILIETFSFSSFMTYVNSSELGAKYQTQITFSWYCIHKDNYT